MLLLQGEAENVRGPAFYGDSESMQLLMVWLDKKDSGEQMQGRASTGAFKGIWSQQANIFTQEILWCSVFIQLKTTHGNARQSTLLFPSLHPMCKRNSVVISFFLLCMTGIKTQMTFVSFSEMLEASRLLVWLVELNSRFSDFRDLYRRIG